MMGEDEIENFRTLWPRWREITEQVGLWCFGCNRRAGVKGPVPLRWIEVLCGHDDCPNLY